MGKPDADDRHIGVLSVEGEPLNEKIGNALVRPFCKAASSKVGNPRLQRRKIYLQENNNPVSLEMLHCSLTVHGAATGGDNVIVADELEKDVFFYSP